MKGLPMEYYIPFLEGHPWGNELISTTSKELNITISKKKAL